MCAKPAFTQHDSPSRRPAQRLRFARSARPMEKAKDARVALDIIIRPSIQLWKLALRRSVLRSIAFKRPKRTVIPCDNASSTSSTSSSKKRVRFDEQPVTITRRGFFERCRRDSCSSPARPCLVVREYDVVHRESPDQLSPETDCRSVYEDCHSDYPGFLADLYMLEGDDEDDEDERCSNTRTPKCIRRSEFYETESGVATFDRAGYANYCLARWLDKQREEARSLSKKLVFEGPALLPGSSRTLPSPSPPPLPSASSIADAATSSMLPLPTASDRNSPRSLPRRIYKYVEDELQNAIVVLLIGLFIHICLLLFLLYDVLTRGLIPSDD